MAYEKLRIAPVKPIAARGISEGRVVEAAVGLSDIDAAQDVLEAE